jgi:hypothetical protein
MNESCARRRPCDSYRAGADEQVWRREASETLEEFEERVLRCALAMLP